MYKGSHLPKPSNIPSKFMGLSGSIYKSSDINYESTLNSCYFCDNFSTRISNVIVPYTICFWTEEGDRQLQTYKRMDLIFGVFWLHSEAMWWMVMSQRAHNLLNCVNVKAPTQRIFMIVVKINDLCYCVQFPCFPCLPDIEAGLSEPGWGGGPCTPSQFWQKS